MMLEQSCTEIYIRLILHGMVNLYRINQFQEVFQVLHRFKKDIKAVVGAVVATESTSSENLLEQLTNTKKESGTVLIIQEL